MLNLFFGAGVGHAHLGAWRRAFAWVLVPGALLFGLLIMIVGMRAGLSLIAPGVPLMFALRIVATLDVFYVPRRKLRRTSSLLVICFWFGSIALAVLAALIFRTTVVQAFRVPSGSMKPTLMPQDHVFAAKGPFRHHPPKRGDLVEFPAPDHPDQSYIKRVIGLPGDEVKVRAGATIINGWVLPRCVIGKGVPMPEVETDGFVEEHHGSLELEYVGDASYLIYIDDNGVDVPGSWKLGPNEVFVLGDNRGNSFDSRSFFHGRGGGIALDSIDGEPIFIWLAFTPAGQVDWSRINLRLDTPHLPSPLAALEPALRTCLNSRPKNTVPPPPAK